uniref:EF-hand calcium-binding domain-containing protein 12-like n=1 Tax=Saccoglossus kowalevskii TaxID=10224 RepID=A0ABM0MJY8_SACKO|nr:PREDICTED: EF-hand calcium-binding domain-containing protein 12-like [Saccoglossus kowalevskii]
MDSLDSDMNDQLDYRELAKGIKDYQLEERKRKKELMESSGSSITKEFERMISCQSMKSIGGQSSRSVSRQSDVRIVSAASQRSQVSIAASQRSQVSIVASQASLDSLDVPKIDITEQVSLCPDDLILKRKKEKVFNRHAKLSSAGKQRVLYGDTKNVKTGNKAVDSHSMCSTLGGEIGDTVDQHRQERLEEYHRIVKMCQDRNVALSAQLLERALLMPGDKPVSRLKKKIAQPGCHLVSRHFADSPTRSKTPIEVKHSDTIHRDKTGQLLMEAKHAYPQKRYVEPQTTMVHLSTGKAFISTKVKCWLTFEEYENLTRDLQKRYVVFNDTVDANAFWPGQLLDKLRLCMDEQDSASGPATVYQSTKQAKPTNSGYNNNLQTWPTDSGYIQFGDITQNKIYTLDSK